MNVQNCILRPQTRASAFGASFGCSALRHISHFSIEADRPKAVVRSDRFKAVRACTHNFVQVRFAPKATWSPRSGDRWLSERRSDCRNAGRRSLRARRRFRPGRAAYQSGARARWRERLGLEQARFARNISGHFRDGTEAFQIARSLDPLNPLDFMCSVGFGSAHVDAGRYEGRRALVRPRDRQAPCGYLDQSVPCAYTASRRQN